MATKKIQIIPPGYTDVCYPQTVASAVIEEADMKFMTAAEKTKLSGIATGANAYVHPATHPASMIVQDASNRFMTDAERTKLSGITAGANAYTHPATHPASVIVQDASNRLVTDTEKATWNAKETTAGSQAKVDAHIAVKTNPHGVTKAQVGLGSVNDYGIATQAEAEAGTSDVKYMTPLSTKQAITKAAPVNATTSVSGLMSNTDKAKLDGVATGANNYIHPATDGNLHVPATGTTNSGRVLKAGSTAGSLSWGTLTAADVGAAPTSHTHSYVPTDRTVNGKALSANISITASDVSAYSKTEIDGKIVDNLTTGGATNVLSAEQGKVLSSAMGQIANDRGYIKTKQVTDFNLAILNGKYNTYDALNSPISGGHTWTLNVTREETGVISQIAHCVFGVPAGRMFIRHLWGTWSAWKEIAFANEVLSLSGGNIVGDLNIGDTANSALRILKSDDGLYSISAWKKSNPTNDFLELILDGSLSGDWSFKNAFSVRNAGNGDLYKVYHEGNVTVSTSAPSSTLNNGCIHHVY